jgi:hypothetical protein
VITRYRGYSISPDSKTTRIYVSGPRAIWNFFYNEKYAKQYIDYLVNTAPPMRGCRCTDCKKARHDLKLTKEKIMATNPAGKNTKTIGINMKKPMAKELERRAKSMQISTGAYCKIILGEWISSGKKLQLKES